MTRLIAVAACLAALAGPAHAEVTNEELEGRWLFEAEAFYGSGVTQEISGEIEFVHAGDNLYRCEFSAVDYIPEEDVWIRSKQVCVATRDGDTLTIESVVIEVEPTTYNYIPDDFTLTIQSGSLMTGVMHVGVDDTGEEPDLPEATFTRGGALLS